MHGAAIGPLRIVNRDLAARPVSRSIALDQCSLVRNGYFTGMSDDESDAKAKAMISPEAVGGANPVPPSAVSTAAWPREGSVLAFIAANCGQCEQNDVCDIAGAPDESCRERTEAASKKPG